jgi:hypothetical protein
MQHTVNTALLSENTRSYSKLTLDSVKGEPALKGILITPHFFTVEALNAAADTQLELINGKKLAILLEEIGLRGWFCL